MWDDLFRAVASINLFELIRTAAPVATAWIAYSALRNWQRQDKAKREAEFLDELLNATHDYIAQLSGPLTVLDFAKIGFKSYAHTWEQGDEEGKAVKGAIAYIDKNGAHEGKRLMELMATVRPSATHLRSLAVKGQMFGFRDYIKCQNAVARLTWVSDRIEHFAAYIGSNWYWDNPEVLRSLKTMMQLNADDLGKIIGESNVALIEFTRDTYQKIYPGPRSIKIATLRLARAKDNTHMSAMARPNIEIEIVRVADGLVDFDAVVAGHRVKLRMSEEFVEDEIKSDDESHVRQYFVDHAGDLEDAAWVYAYNHSTQGKKPDDPPGPVPYRSTVTRPFDKIQVRAD